MLESGSSEASTREAFFEVVIATVLDDIVETVVHLMESLEGDRKGYELIILPFSKPGTRLPPLLFTATIHYHF